MPIERSSRPFQRRLVLIADKEPSVRSLIIQIISGAGLTPLPVENGQVVLATIQTYASELACIIFDLTLPIGNPIKSIDQMRQLAPDVPIVLTGGYVSYQFMEHFRQLPAIYFLNKPFSIADLRQMLYQFISPLERSLPPED